MQHRLWHDGYIVLQAETGEIGQTRLRRFLNWLDRVGRDWTEPDLDAYADYLRDEIQLGQSAIYQNTSELRNHYLAILANPDNYDHIAPEDRAAIVDTVLEGLGYNTDSVSYEHLTEPGGQFISDNMRVLLSPTAHRHRDTQLVAFVHWMDKTGRHWTQPDLLEYKEHLLKHEGMTLDVAGNAVNTIRRRYQDIVEEGSELNSLTNTERQAFLDEFRKRLGYLDQYPSRAAPTRAMLEDDPYSKNYLSQAQVAALLSKPDLSTFVGIRDRALIGLAVGTGIQQAEIARVQVGDLRHNYQGVPALSVAASKQREARLIPYDDNIWVLDWIDAWLQEADICEGPVFRGTYGNRDVLRPHGIAPETASDILARYPIEIHGTDVPLLFADLRATCARRWYEIGIDFEEIERRLGINYRRALLKLLGLRVRRVFGG